jgi:hypothetical protein
VRSNPGRVKSGSYLDDTNNILKYKYPGTDVRFLKCFRQTINILTKFGQYHWF